MLLKKYPGADAEGLKNARAYSYGGSMVADMGYAPGGKRFFSDLVHYVRTGDFSKNLLAEAQNLEEYAFALGYLCHYFADVTGHSISTNQAVPMLFDCAHKKYGDTATYEQGKTWHARVEFSFDVLQVARGNYASENFHDFIGFKINQPVLERAFLKTYGMPMDELFGNFSRSVSTFRFGVRSIFPRLTKASWIARKTDLLKLNPLAKRKDHLYRLPSKAYRKEFGRPGLMSVVFVLLPKVGPLAKLKFKAPTREVERLFDESFAAILKEYSAALKRLQRPDFQLLNLNWDTGTATAPGEYKLADVTHCELLLKLEKGNFAEASDELRTYLLAFYSQPNLLRAPDLDSGKWKKIQAALAKLRLIRVDKN